MKYILIIPDGAADLPVSELSGKTPLEAAHIPTIDSLARHGTCGSVQTVPDGFEPGSDVAIMSVIGYDPSLYYTGRAPLEAAAMKLELSPDNWVLRCNLVTLDGETMADHSAGGITTGDARPLIDILNKNLSSPTVCFISGVGYRNLLLWKRDLSVSTTPPHDILGKPYSGYYPQGRDAEALVDLMVRSRDILKAASSGSANGIWFWGQGRRTQLPSFLNRYGVRGSVITAVDLVRGLAGLIGWQVRIVPGATGYFDTDYHGKGSEAIAALAENDLVCVHIEATDEAGHAGDWRLKIAALEAIDRHIVKPLWQTALSGNGETRLLVVPDHPTPCSLRTHTSDPVPFCLAGSGVKADRTEAFSESACSRNRKSPMKGSHLMGTLINPQLLTRKSRTC